MGSTLEQLIAQVETRLEFLGVAHAGRSGSDAQYEEAKAYRDMIDDLVTSEGAKFKTRNGTYELALAGIRTSCTAGGRGLIKAWLRKAKVQAEVWRAA